MPTTNAIAKVALALLVTHRVNAFVISEISWHRESLKKRFSSTTSAVRRSGQHSCPVDRLSSNPREPIRTQDLNAIFSSSTIQSLAHTDHNAAREAKDRHESNEVCKKDWIARSVRYYSTVRRMNTKKANENSAKALEEENRIEFVALATKHYCALRKIHSGEFYHAERIYQRVIDQVIRHRQAKGHCDHEVLAASTLLLALLKQRMGDLDATYEVFMNFFKIVGEDEVCTCPCSAKVLQAFALFEMKRGHRMRSLYLANRAVALDENLAPVFKWKQFADAGRRLTRNQRRAHWLHHLFIVAP